MKKWLYRHRSLMVQTGIFSTIFAALTYFIKEEWLYSPSTLICVSLLIAIMAQCWKKGIAENTEMGKNKSVNKAGYYDQYRTIMLWIPILTVGVAVSLFNGWSLSALYITGLQLMYLLILNGHRNNLKRRL